MEGTTLQPAERYRRKDLSVMRIAATIAVVFAHSCSTITAAWGTSAFSQTQLAFLEICQGVTAWHVPLFFMISGALLLNREQVSIHDCIFKYARRMLLALLVFGIPFALILQVFDTHTFTIDMLVKALIMTVNGDSFSHLWYLFAMIGIYLILPILKLIVSHGSKKMLWYMMSLLFLFEFFLPAFNRIFGQHMAFMLPFGTYAVFYFLMGYALMQVGQDKLKARRWASIILVLGITGIILKGIITGSAKSMMSYHSPLNAAITISMYILLTGKLNGCCSDRLWKLDRLCFGVYLIHPVFIQFTYRFLKWNPLEFKCWPVMIFAFAAVFVILSFGAAWIARLVKPLKKCIL